MRPEVTDSIRQYNVKYTPLLLMFDKLDKICTHDTMVLDTPNRVSVHARQSHGDCINKQLMKSPVVDMWRHVVDTDNRQRNLAHKWHVDTNDIHR